MECFKNYCAYKEHPNVFKPADKFPIDEIKIDKKYFDFPNPISEEDVIKIQHNCKSTPYWKSQSNKYNFLLIMHEHLFIFRKPKHDEDLNRIRYNVKAN